MTATTESVPRYWSEESSSRPGRARIRARINGLHCSLCTGTIEKALGRQPGVDKVAVSLTHEQVLIEYDPQVIRPEVLLQTLKGIGYTPPPIRASSGRSTKRKQHSRASAQGSSPPRSAA